MEIRNDYSYESMPEFTENVDGAVTLETTGEERSVYYVKDVVYCQKDGQPLHLQVLIPYTRNSGIIDVIEEKAGADPSRCPVYPCVVFVQGSAWMEQDLYSSLYGYSKLAEQGFVVAVAEYRHSGIAPFPAQVIDVRNAVRYMRKKASLFFVDPDKILIGGNSSGGHVAMFAGLLKDDDDPVKNLYPGISADVCGIINQYGSTDFTFEDSNPTTENYNLPDSPEGRVMGGADMRRLTKLAEILSVKTHITETTDLPPVLILHGTKDRLVNTKCSVYLYQKLKECGKDAQLVILKGADHGGPEFFSEPVLKIQTDFLNRCIGQNKTKTGK